MSEMHAVGQALSVAGSMTWQIAWALILGFALSAVVQAVVRRSTIVRLLGDDRRRTLARATAFGIASSSCSYAAVALARSLFRKGANFTAAMAFEISSTNLVIELGVILALLMGWQFTLAEFAGGPVMIVVIAAGFRLFLRDKLLREAGQQADQALAGSMEGHAAMDMLVRFVRSGGLPMLRMMNGAPDAPPRPWHPRRPRGPRRPRSGRLIVPATWLQAARTREGYEPGASSGHAIHTEPGPRQDPRC
jgi:uncharacterized membrane protein YraQ (UPF0718 family)